MCNHVLFVKIKCPTFKLHVVFGGPNMVNAQQIGVYDKFSS